MAAQRPKPDTPPSKTWAGTMEGECSCFDGGDKRAAAIADVGAAAGTPGMVLDIYSVACFQVMSGEFWSRQ
jgi:hypothetical protein